MWWCCFCGQDEESQPDRLLNGSGADNFNHFRDDEISCAETTGNSVILDNTLTNSPVPKQNENTTPALGNFHSNYMYENEIPIIDDCIDTCLKDVSWLHRPRTVGPQSYFSADFGRWLKNDVIYIKPTFDYNANDIFGTVETILGDYSNPYQEFELFASWKKGEVYANQTAVPDTYSGFTVNPISNHGQNARSKGTLRVEPKTYSEVLSHGVARHPSAKNKKSNKNNKAKSAGNPVTGVASRSKQIHAETTSTGISKQCDSNESERNTKRNSRYLKSVDIMKCTQNSYIVNKEVHLSAKNWHTIIDVDKDSFCLLCSVMYHDNHINEECHLLRLHRSTYRIMNKGSNVIRELLEKKLYHCGICNIAIDSEEELNLHIHSETHRDKFFSSRNKCRYILAARNNNYT